MKNGERFIYTPSHFHPPTLVYNNYSDSYNDTPDSQFRHYTLHDGYGDIADNYGSLSRGVNYRPYRPLHAHRWITGRRTATLSLSAKDDYGHMAQPQVPMGK